MWNQGPRCFGPGPSPGRYLRPPPAGLPRFVPPVMRPPPSRPLPPCDFRPPPPMRTPPPPRFFPRNPPMPNIGYEPFRPMGGPPGPGAFQEMPLWSPGPPLPRHRPSWRPRPPLNAKRRSGNSQNMRNVDERSFERKSHARETLMQFQELVTEQFKTNISQNQQEFESPEVLERWKSERQRKYPSAANVTVKQVIHKKPVREGRVPTRRFGKMQKRNQVKWHGRGRGFPKNRRNMPYRPRRQNGMPLNTIVDPGYISFEDNSIQLEKFKGTKNLPKLELSRIIDDISDSDSKIKVNGDVHPVTDSEGAADAGSDSDGPDEYRSTVNPKVAGSNSERLNLPKCLSRLVAAYDDDDDDDDDKFVSDTPQSIPVAHIPTNKSTRISRTSKKRGPHTQFDRQLQKRRPTLLENLLADNIRHERNVILQCVQFIVKNDFFGEGSNTSLLTHSIQECGNGEIK